MKEDVSAPFIRMMEQAKEMAILADEMAKEAHRLYEESKRREAIGTNLVLKFRDEERFEWADLAKSLWPTPIPKVEDLSATSCELLKYYTEAYEDAVSFLEQVRQAGLRPGGGNMYELEVQALDRLVSELEAKIEEMDIKIEQEQEAERVKRRAEKRAEQGLAPEGPDETEGEEEALPPNETGLRSLRSLTPNPNWRSLSPQKTQEGKRKAVSVLR